MNFYEKCYDQFMYDVFILHIRYTYIHTIYEHVCIQLEILLFRIMN